VLETTLDLAFDSTSQTSYEKVRVRARNRVRVRVRAGLRQHVSDELREV